MARAGGLSVGRSLLAVAILAMATPAFAADAAKPTASQPAGRTYALFAGVAEYQFAKGRVPGGRLDDLGGAPQDIKTIKAALESRFPLVSSTVLLGHQATRKGILDGLARLIDQAGAGDTVVFYFSGHGAQMLDMTGTQETGFNSTIVPYDARNPKISDPALAGDILDVELREVIAAANAGGVNVVTIMDSCNSGTVTRSTPYRPLASVRAKLAPAIGGTLKAQPPPIHKAPSLRAGYRVHLAAVPDGVTADERLVEGVWRGDFTQALAKALAVAPSSATYQDVLTRTRVNLELAGTTPKIRGEGDLDAPFLNGQQTSLRLIGGARQPTGEYLLSGGELSGVTVGSSFKGYATGGDAINGQPPAAEGVVTSATPFEARLRVTRGATGTSPQALQWRPISRGVDDRMRLQVIGGDAAQRAALGKTLARLTFVQSVDKEPDVGLDLRDPQRVTLARADGALLAAGPASDTALLANNLERLARYQALLKLGAGDTPPKVRFEMSETSCTSADPRPFAIDGGEPILETSNRRNRFHLKVRNDEEAMPIFVHLLNLAADQSVTLLYPPADTDNAEPVAPGGCWSNPANASGEGREYFLLIAADRALPAIKLLEQGSLATRSAAPRGADPLQNLIADAASGLRSASPSAPGGTWGAITLSYRVTAEISAQKR